MSSVSKCPAWDLLDEITSEWAVSPVSGSHWKQQQLGELGSGVKVKTPWFTRSAFLFGKQRGRAISPYVGNQQKGLRPVLRGDLGFSERPSVEGKANFRVERLSERRREASQLSCCFPDQGRAGSAMSIFGASLSLLTQALSNSQLSHNCGSRLSVQSVGDVFQQAWHPLGCIKS